MSKGRERESEGRLEKEKCQGDAWADTSLVEVGGKPPYQPLSRSWLCGFCILGVSDTPTTRHGKAFLHIQNLVPAGEGKQAERSGTKKQTW